MDTKHYAKVLTHERETLKTELQELGTQDPLVTSDWVATTGEDESNEADENLVADRAEEWVSRNGELSELEVRYRNVIHALDKISKGIFGTCEICNAPIEEARLNANPAARTCIAHLNDEVDLTN